MKSRLRRLYLKLWPLIPLLIALVSLLCKRLWLTAESYGWPDTASYFHSWEILKNGGFDCFRTPLYPAFIGAIHDLFPSSALTVILVIQNALYILSAPALAGIGRTALRLPHWLAILACVPYCTAYVYNLYPDFILTDSLATSLFIFFVFATLRYLSDPGHPRAILLTIASFALIMFRPSFLFIPVAAVCMVPFLWRPHRRAARGILAGVAACLIATGAYAAVYRTYSGKWGISAVSEANIMLMHTHYTPAYDPQIYPIHYALSHKPEMRLEVWDAVSVIAAHKPRLIYDEVEKIQDERPGITFHAIRSSIFRNLRRPLADTHVPLFIIPVLAFIYGILVLIRIIRRSTLSLGSLWLWLLISTQLTLILLNAPNEYQRLLMPVIPLIFLACADIFRTAVKAVPLPRQGNSCSPGDDPSSSDS